MHPLWTAGCDVTAMFRSVGGGGEVRDSERKANGGEKQTRASWNARVQTASTCPLKRKFVRPLGFVIGVAARHPVGCRGRQWSCLV